jgi:hypothetical protein
MKRNDFGPLHPQPTAPRPSKQQPINPAAPAPIAQHILGDPFARDRFLLKQRMLTISQKYDVCDEAGNRILFVRRPAHALRNMAALLAGVFTFFVIALGCIAAAGAVIGNDKSLEWLLAVAAIIGLIGGIFGAAVVAIAIAPRRHVTMFRDEGMAEALLHVRQDQKWALINMRYTITDARGQSLAILRKNYFYDIFRKKWICEKPDNAGVLCVIREDNIVKAFLRRFVGGVLAALLRTNYIITDESQQRQIGKFDRKFTILDRYVLDLTADTEGVIDRRVGLAIGVMLDTGERR